MLTTKPKIAFFDFTGCEGCQLTAVDALQDCPELLGAVEIVQFREAMSEKGEDYQIAFIEGSCSRPEDEERLKSIRGQASTVIAFGACAHLGGVNALRAWRAQDEVRRYVYGELAKFYSSGTVKPIEAVIPIEGYIPGCPIDRREFLRSVQALLLGRPPDIPDYPVCVECRLAENVCLFSNGAPCLGPVTRAGCAAVCPSFGAPCMGCRGQVSNANLGGLAIALSEAGIDDVSCTENMQLFQSFQMRKDEAYG